MDRREVAELVQDSVNSAIVHSKNEILSGVQLLISSEMKKVTENQRVLADMQISKIADLSSDYKFKRRSNEEQFKINKKVLGKLDDCERNLDCSETDKAKENLAEGKILGITREFSFKITRYNNHVTGMHVGKEYMYTGTGKGFFFTHKKKKKKKAPPTTTTNHLLIGLYLHIKDAV